ncbi:hypothetical protein ANN_07925 [Periplaneta americana]|uniref:Uncharacterized protein n=1 Tax=Periplaneta americana TaxID=6978 RepID=A0ABQ8SZZ2_PERAM|nr:hypothetical protein ANN_07925 [Periplaneta americana]
MLVSSAWQTYQENPTTVTIVREQETECSLPAITVCQDLTIREWRRNKFLNLSWGNLIKPRRKLYYKSLVHHIANFSYWNLEHFHRYVLDPTLPNSQYERLQEWLRKDEIVMTLGMQNIGLDKYYRIQPVLSETGYCSCLACLYKNGSVLKSFLSLEKDGRLTVPHRYVQTVKIALSFKPVKVYVHSPHDVPNYMTPRWSITKAELVRDIMFTRQIKISEALHDLSISQRKCLFPYENPLTVSKRYTRNMCLMQCRRELAVKLCGCSPHVYVLNDDDRVRICEIEDFSCLSAHKKMLYFFSHNKNCSCYPECRSLSFNLVHLITMRNKCVIVRLNATSLGGSGSELAARPVGFYFPPMTDSEEDLLPLRSFTCFKTLLLSLAASALDNITKYQLLFEGQSWITYYNDVVYSKVDMIASWGGSVSFFLGASLLSVVEAVYLLLRLPCCALYYYITHFHLDGCVNKHNCPYWSTKNPQEKQRPVHSAKVTVWAAWSSQGITGPFFFQDWRGRTVTVNADRYSRMIERLLGPTLQNFVRFNDETWFQQDEAESHTANVSLRTVGALFPEKLISRRGDINWPPRSPELTSLTISSGAI